MNLANLSASTFSPEVNDILKAMLAISTLIVIIVWVGIVYFCIKYRKSAKVDRTNPPVLSYKLEGALISVMVVFALSSFIYSAHLYYKMHLVPKNSIEVDVIAKQWMWKFHDPAKGDQINLLTVPINKPIHLLMTSEDVIHSFFVPAFRIKQDVLPGSYTSLWFQATKLGRYEVLCSQFCGLSHSLMRAIIEVVPEDVYQNLQNSKLTDLHLQNGKRLFASKGCISCHEGEHPIGPSLKGIYQKRIPLNSGGNILADENYLRRSILRPNAEVVAGFNPIMPTFQGQLTESEVLDLIHFIKSEKNYGNK